MIKQHCENYDVKLVISLCCQRVRDLHYQRGKIKQSHTDLVFLLLLLLFFCFSLILSLLVLFYFVSCETQRKHILNVSEFTSY